MTPMSGKATTVTQGSEFKNVATAHAATHMPTRTARASDDRHASRPASMKALAGQIAATLVELRVILSAR
jgi:hypothetical protein